jgi:hypothetical protein
MLRAFDENARREMAIQKSLMDPSGKKEEGTTYAVMAGRRHRGNGKKGNGCRTRPGTQTLEKRIGKAADRRINP